jgi:hypothetical protein
MSADREYSAPPVGEEIHLPGPSFLPILMAFGITLAVIGVTLSIVFIFFGVLIILITGFLWIREAREEFDELPPDHGH